MNYIQESLAMQQRLWMALLEGGETEEQQAESLPRKETAPASRREKRREAAMEIEAAGSRVGGWAEQTGETGAAGAGFPQEAEPMSGRRAALSWTGETAEATLPDGGSAEGGEETGKGAETLSRVFQRDARRYDGGFPLY